MLEIANLEVVYNEVILVLRGLSLTVPDGEIVALLGSNGAGKTTTLRAITGLLDVHDGKVTKGSVTFDGERIDSLDPGAIVRRGHQAGDGRPPGLRRDDRRREPHRRRLHEPQPGGRRHRLRPRDDAVPAPRRAAQAGVRLPVRR